MAARGGIGIPHILGANSTGFDDLGVVVLGQCFLRSDVVLEIGEDVELPVLLGGLRGGFGFFFISFSSHDVLS